MLGVGEDGKMIKYKKITHDITPLLQKVKNVMGKDSDIIFAYFFGSHGKGTPHPLSDVDIAVYLIPEVKDITEKKLKLHEILSKILLTDEIDIVILNNVPISLAMEVLKTKKLLASSDEEKRFSFETRIMKEYMDTLWLRELSEQSLMRRIKEGKYGYSRIG